MAKIETSREFPGMSASQCYNAFVSMVDQSEYVLFKKRDIAYLVICDGTVEGSAVHLTLTVPLGGPTRITVNLSSDNLEESILLIEANRILELVSKNM